MQAVRKAHCSNCFVPGLGAQSVVLQDGVDDSTEPRHPALMLLDDDSMSEGDSSHCGVAVKVLHSNNV